MGQASFPAEIFEVENVGSTFGRSSEQLGGVDFDEIVFKVELSVELADC